MPPKRKAADAPTKSTRTATAKEPEVSAKPRTTRQKKAVKAVDELVAAVDDLVNEAKKATEAVEAPKKRGKSTKAAKAAKASSDEAEPAVDETPAVDEQPTTDEKLTADEPPTTKRRGRATAAKPKKAVPTTTKATARTKKAPASKTKKVDAEEEAIQADAQLQEEAQEAVGKAEGEEPDEGPVVKKRGRPAKGGAKAESKVSTAPAAKGRGRRAAAPKEEKAAPAPTSRARGRAKKETPAEKAEVAAPKARGRPKKVAAAEDTASDSKPLARGRGKRKAAFDEESASAQPAKKPRGRAAKTKTTYTEAETSNEVPSTGEEQASELPKRKRGRPSKGADQEEAATQAGDINKSTDDTPRIRGRPSKSDAGPLHSSASASSTPKPRGRPRKSTGDEPAESTAQSPQKRGRPSKAGTELSGDTPKRRLSGAAPATVPAASRKAHSPGTPLTALKKRGRPSKATPTGSTAATPRGTGGKRGRPRVSFGPDVVSSPAPGSARRGRPPKPAAPIESSADDESNFVADSDERPSKRPRRESAQPNYEEVSEAPETQDEEMPDAPPEDEQASDVVPEVNGETEPVDIPTTPKRSRVSKKPPKTAPAKKREGRSTGSRRVSSPGAATRKRKAGDDKATLPLSTKEADDGPHYWLLKAEPDSRIENGKDVKFSIDDLKNATEPEPWTGVRNYGARNNMMAMKRGEKAFFYHSSCKVPGVVGIMEIVNEATPDLSAFDENDPYYDAKSSQDKPKWFNVHVEFRQKFDDSTKTSLTELRKYTESSLSELQLLKQSRLSVTKVSKKEWNFILNLAGETEFLAEIDTTEPALEEPSEIIDATAAAEPDTELSDLETSGFHDVNEDLIGDEVIQSNNEELEEEIEELAEAIEETIDEVVDQVAVPVAAEVAAELGAEAEQEIQEEIREELTEQITEQIVAELHNNGGIGQVISHIAGPTEVVANAVIDIEALGAPDSMELSELPDASILVQHTIEIREEAADDVPEMPSTEKRTRRSTRRTSRASSQPRSRRSSRAPSLPAADVTPAKQMGALLPPATVPHAPATRMVDLADQPLSDPIVPIGGEVITETYTEVHETTTTGGGGQSYGMDYYAEESSILE